MSARWPDRLSAFPQHEGIALNLRKPSPSSATRRSYGPFTIDGGKHTSEGNENFDKSLRGQNPEWGYRDVEEIKAQAATRGLASEAVISMPANNFTLVFRKLGDAP